MMASSYRKAMELLYWICAWLAGVSLVLVAAVIPYSVYTRYVLNQAASWPEPMAILLTIVLTFFGAAACYRDSVHMRVMFFVGLMPVLVQRLLVVVSECLVAVVSLFIANYRYGFFPAALHSSVCALSAPSAGLPPLSIPPRAAITLLFSHS